MNFIKINYTGTVKDGKVFDTTDADMAKKEEIFDESRAYSPLSVAVGEGQVIKGLDAELAGMKVGDKKKVEINPQDAYGDRTSEKVKLVPIKHFKKEGINPIPGMPVEIDNMRGKVQTVSGGRVRVDFNHELAGKTLIFDVTVVEKAKDDKEKVGYLLERNFAGIDGVVVDLKAKNLELALPKEAFHDRQLMVRKASFSAEAFRFLDLAHVKFTETWESPKVDESKADKKSSKAKSKK